MKTNSEKVREKTSSRIEKRLLSYSVAAGAALAVAGPSQAAVHYSGPRGIVVNNANPMESIDLNGDGIPDFEFDYLDSSTFFFGITAIYRGLLVFGANGNLIGETDWWGEPYRLGAGNSVSQGVPGSWLYYGALNLSSFYNYTTTRWINSSVMRSYGNFIDEKGYLGVRFDIDGHTHYGWIEYEGTGFVEGKITGWAYEDVAGMGIQAGDTGVKAEPVPTLNQWGLFFLMGLILAAGAGRLKRGVTKEG